MAKNLVEDSSFLSKKYTKNSAVNFPKNLILYGPPGTGKTYHTVNYALAIIEGKSLEEIGYEKRSELQNRFHQYKEAQQIEFVTFHQSYTYEDFIQGLRPNTQAGTLIFEKKDGILKRIADRAKKNYDNFIHQQKKPKIPFEDLLNLLLSKKINPDTEEIEILLDVSHRIYKSIIVFDITEEALLYRRRTKNDIIKDEERKLSFFKLKALYGGQDIKEAINEKYYQAVVEAVKAYEENLIDEEEEQHELKNYVIIMDEINRANISRVFGELITLMEEDKRYGTANALTLTLPSGEHFCLPSNLYILGTMNTADKSIALLDIALRRRFTFEAKYPDENLIEDSGIKNILIKLNEALLEEKKSADFLIGHAFFLGKSKADLPYIFDKQILPLLEEYFPNRPDKIAKILKQAGIPTEVRNYRLVYKD